MRTVEALRAAIARGETFQYLLFWGHRAAKNGAVTASCFSQWFPAPFEDETGLRYPTAEHYMMAGKAALFDDMDTHDAILATPDPGKAKSLGRQVKRFDDELWTANRWDMVVEGNLLKFTQNERLGHFLLGTRDQVLVEASPVDTIWGIGLAADKPEAKHPELWRGENLLGFALMEVRERLRAARMDS